MNGDLYSALEARGLRLTAARRAIIDTLVELGGHVTADELTDLLRGRETGIGRMTIYRTLDLLCDLGLLRPAYQGTGAAHYILLHDGHHHHLVCSGCSRVIEFDDCGLDELSTSVARRYGFRVEGHLLELYGVCADCRGAAAEG
ncbi:MAG TPA: Fur family transcriptional regulator [Promineifilum sp.]|nr:Fur family transcriptional regulator [Promineifilum sp.]HRQ14203.1 Fur family transcriptional regulator [Promineifilum sp.]